MHSPTKHAQKFDAAIAAIRARREEILAQPPPSAEEVRRADARMGQVLDQWATLFRTEAAARRAGNRQGRSRAPRCGPARRCGSRRGSRSSSSSDDSGDGGGSDSAEPGEARHHSLWQPAADLERDQQHEEHFVAGSGLLLAEEQASRDPYLAPPALDCWHRKREKRVSERESAARSEGEHQSVVGSGPKRTLRSQLAREMETDGDGHSLGFGADGWTEGPGPSSVGRYASGKPTAAAVRLGETSPAPVLELVRRCKNAGCRNPVPGNQECQTCRSKKSYARKKRRKLAAELSATELPVAA